MGAFTAKHPVGMEMITRSSFSKPIYSVKDSQQKRTIGLATTPFSTRPDSLETTAPYKFFTYLLIYLVSWPTSGNIATETN